MLKVLIVDDSEERVEILKNEINKHPSKNLLEIIVCDTADKGRIQLLEPTDLLILDVVLPKKRGGTPSALNSLKLLDDIYSNTTKLIRPKIIVGLTADVSELGNYRERFFSSASVVLDGSLGNLQWIDSLFKQLDTLINSLRNEMQLTKDNLLISVHGIRTRGEWQSRLTSEIKQYSKTFEYIEIKYGFVDLFSFFIPQIRKRKSNKVSERLKNALEKNSSKEITLICHSFGTLIAARTLQKTFFKKKIKTLIFCGSPLPKDEDLALVLSSSERMINECGNSDFILILARCLVWGLGDAGRVGFDLDNTATFVNRYHKGGHGLYFKEKCGFSFIESNWIPIITSNDAILPVDTRKSYFGEDFVDLLVKIIGFVKPYAYILLIFIVIKNITF
ncbi:alpha/beta hydrolase [Pantoea agglomerans]|uniref:lipase family protein n=1 Tax=Enterobacter agglomerans TaxID=549 RepID=UPI0032088C16